MRVRRFLMSVAVAATFVVGLPGAGRAQGLQYEVTITNLTRGQTFTPVFVATHGGEVRFFELGRPAIPQLAIVAEEGDLAPLVAVAQGLSAVSSIATTGMPPAGFVPPGQSRTLILSPRSTSERVSLAAMLIPTNDAFVAINGVGLPAEMVSLDALAYDSGTERNDERCASIPGPSFAECGGPGGGGQPTGGEEGYVHVHAGMHGIGDMRASDRDWRNPVARVTIRRTR